jgi:hypothetical protein
MQFSITNIAMYGEKMGSVRAGKFAIVGFEY